MTEKNFEYKTTHGDLYREYADRDGSVDIYPPDNPVPPEGSGWEMVGFTASTAKLYWSWRRLVPSTLRIVK